MADLDVIRPKRLARCDAGALVLGITQLDDRFYAVCGNNKILVYDAVTFAQLDDVILDGRKTEVWDITAYNDKRSMYVYDFKNRCVSLVTDEGRHIKEWIRHESSRISVTSDGDVLLLTEDPPKLKIYQPDGTVEREIKLPSDMKEPKHAVESGSGTYFVSHGWTADSLHRVCEVNSDGQIVRSYGGQPGSADDQFNGPVHMAVDSQGHLYVADWDNNRVVVLDRTLSKCKVISKYDGVRPLRLCYVPELERLLIGLFDGHIDVYSLE